MNTNRYAYADSDFAYVLPVDRALEQRNNEHRQRCFEANLKRIRTELAAQGESLRREGRFGTDDKRANELSNMYPYNSTVVYACRDGKKCLCTIKSVFRIDKRNHRYVCMGKMKGCSERTVIMANRIVRRWHKSERAGNVTRDVKL